MVSKMFNGKPYTWVADFQYKKDAEMVAKRWKDELGMTTKIVKGGYKGKEWELYARPK